MTAAATTKHTIITTTTTSTSTTTTATTPIIILAPVIRGKESSKGPKGCPPLGMLWVVAGAVQSAEPERVHGTSLVRQLITLDGAAVEEGRVPQRHLLQPEQCLLPRQ